MVGCRRGLLVQGVQGQHAACGRVSVRGGQLCRLGANCGARAGSHLVTAELDSEPAQHGCRHTAPLGKPARVAMPARCAHSKPGDGGSRGADTTDPSIPLPPPALPSASSAAKSSVCVWGCMCYAQPPPARTRQGVYQAPPPLTAQGGGHGHCAFWAATAPEHLLHPQYMPWGTPRARIDCAKRRAAAGECGPAGRRTTPSRLTGRIARLPHHAPKPALPLAGHWNRIPGLRMSNWRSWG